MTDPEIVAELEAELEEIEVDGPVVGIVLSSEDDRAVMQPAEQTLRDRGVPTETRVLPLGDRELGEYAEGARGRGLRVLIVASARSGAPAVLVAARTDLPVIGVPLSSLTSIAGGLDALSGMAQAAEAVPVACVGLDSAQNAGLLAARILQA